MSVFTKRDLERPMVNKKSDQESGLEAMMKVKAAKVALVQDEEVIDAEASSLLNELGFTHITEKLKSIAEVKTKENMAAVSGYTRIPRETFDQINKELKEYTRREIDRMGGRAYVELLITSVSDYKGVPPKLVLQEMKKAKDASIFDTFSIIAPSLREIPDPILVGEINGSNDLYAITEWGEDIKIADFTRFEKKSGSSPHFSDQLITDMLQMQMQRFGNMSL